MNAGLVTRGVEQSPEQYQALLLDAIAGPLCSASLSILVLGIEIET